MDPRAHLLGTRLKVEPKILNGHLLELMKGTDMKLETGDAYIDPRVQGGDEGKKRRVKTPT